MAVIYRLNLLLEALMELKEALAQGQAGSRKADSITLLPLGTYASGAEPATGYGQDIDTNRYESGYAGVYVTSVSGSSPLVRVCVEGKLRAGENVYVPIACASFSAPGVYPIAISPLPFGAIRTAWRIESLNTTAVFAVYGEFK